MCFFFCCSQQKNVKFRNFQLNFAKIDT
jgi:hypothetical protein